jgi:diguanylate cyclase (GGDEF)-like protein
MADTAKDRCCLPFDRTALVTASPFLNNETILIIGAASALDNHLMVLGLPFKRFDAIDPWWNNQSWTPSVIVLHALQPLGGSNGFDLTRILKQVPQYQTLPIILFDPFPAEDAHFQQYRCHMDAYCNTPEEVLEQMGVLSTMFNRLANPPEHPVPFHKLVTPFNHYVLMSQLQDDIHQLSELLPDITSSVHMAFSLLEHLFPYQAAGILLCNPQSLLPDVFYVGSPYGKEGLSPLTQQYLANHLTEKLPFNLNGVLRIEALSGASTDMGFMDMPMQCLWHFGTAQIAYGALALWGRMPIPQSEVLTLVRLRMRDWFKQASWVRQLHHGESIDAVTQVYQYAYMMRHLQQEVQRAKRYEHPVCIIKIVADNIEVVNQLHGFAAGDQALRHIAQIIQANVRESDLVGRYRTNEFLVVMPETALSDAETAAKRLLQDVDLEPISVGQTVFMPSIRIGVSCLQDGEGDADTLLKAAQAGLQAATETQRMVTQLGPTR